MKKSKILSLLLSVLMLVSSISCLSVVASAAVVDGGYEYDEGGNVLTTYWELDDAGVLTIYSDTSPTWLDHAVSIKRVVLEAGVTMIPAGAFQGCLNLIDVDTSKAVAELDYIGASAFVGCDSLTEFVTSATLNGIGAGSFQALPSLERVSFAYIGEVPDYAFYNCDKLSTVFIGGGFEVDKVGKNIFKSCDALTTVVFGNGTKVIGEGMFDDCVALSNVTLPDSLESIGSLAFENCQSLDSITIPDSVRTVGDYAFYDCVNAIDLYVGHSVENFGEFAFGNNISLQSATFKCKMPIISTGMFYGCESLTSVVLPQGVQSIGAQAFMGCTSLTSFEIPNTTTMIGESAFDGTSLAEITIPWNVVDIGVGAFTNCVALENINVDDKNTTFASVDGALYDISLDILLCCPAGKTGTYTIKNGTTTISDGAFIGCEAIDVIEAPESVTTISDNALNGCSDDLVIKTGCKTAFAEYAAKRDIKTDLIHSADTKWIETLAPTCTVAGEKSSVCSLCEHVFVTESIDALGHEYDTGIVTKKATCEEDGVVTFTCTRTGCGDSYTEVLPKTEHKYNDGEVIVDPTCETEGTKRFTCQNEGCYKYYDITVPALKHSYDKGVVTTAATCEADGVMTFTCTRTDCGDTYTEVIPAIGHSYDSGVVTTAASCEDDGVKTFTCLNCGDSYTEVIPAIGHNYVETPVKPATCVENGKNICTCSNCGDSYEVATTGEHQLYSQPVKVEPTCTEEGKEGMMCAICGQYVGAVSTVPATGHTYENGACVDCGDKDPDYKVVRPATPKMKLIRNEVKGISVTWTKVNGAKSYRVYRRGAGDRYWTYIDTVTTNSYLDSNAITGEYWRYTVRAVNEAGYSGYENGIYIKRVDTPKMTSIANTSNGIKVTWSKVSNAKEYRVYRRGAGGAWVYLGITTGTSYVDTAVKNAHGQYYRYTVRAVDGYYSNFESGIYIKRA